MPQADPLQPGKLPRPRIGAPVGQPAFSVDQFSIKLAAGLRLVLESVAKGRSQRRGLGTPESDACPVNPNRPLNLSGGAAAALEFDD